MIITKTPFRMSFFGGGTDLESFFREHGGHLPRFFEYKTHLTYSRTEYVNEYDEIEHPLIREAMRKLDMHELRLTYDSDLPAKSGLGTSSSFAVGMLNAFHSLKGKYVSKKQLADEAIYLERKLCHEAGGWQDQIAASFGGLNRINFNDDGYEVHPIIISPERKEQLNKNLLLFFTGFVRYSSEVQEANASKNKKKTECLLEMLKLVDDAERILNDKHSELDDFGKLLDHTWKLKRGTGKVVSTEAIDDIYENGKKAGALGGKLLGAGGGGFLLFYVQPEKHSQVIEAMNGLLHIPFEFESGGTSVIHYTPELFDTEKIITRL